MPANVTIRRWTGSASSPTKSNITGGNTVANANDTHQSTASGSSDPIRIPTSGNNFSYWVSTRLSADTSPAGTINNLRWHTDGTNNFGTGVTCKAQNANAGADAGYRQATGTAGTTGNELNTTNHTGLTAAPADAFTFTSSSPKSLSGSISNPNTGDFGDFMVYQIIVASSAEPGVTGTETFTWLYDET